MQCPHQNRILARRGSRTVRATPSRAGCVSHVRSSAIFSSSSMRSPAMLVCGFPDCPGCPPHSLFLRGPPPIPAPPCFRPPGLSGLAHTSSVTIDMRSPAISGTFLLLASRTVRAGPLSVRSASPCGPPPLPGIFLLLVSRTVRADPHQFDHHPSSSAASLCSISTSSNYMAPPVSDAPGLSRLHPSNAPDVDCLKFPDCPGCPTTACWSLGLSYRHQ